MKTTQLLRGAALLLLVSTLHRSNSSRRLGRLAGALAIAFSLLHPSPAAAQTRTNPCETVMQFGTGTSPSGAKLRPGSVDPFFQGLGAIFPNSGDTYVLTDPPATWIANSASADSQWVGPSTSVIDDVAGVYIYYLPLIMPCAGGSVTGRYAASDRAALRLNGAPVSFPTAATGWTTWTTFSFNNLLPGLNRLEFVVTNSQPVVGGPPGPTGLRAELTATATCCPCIELSCPPEILLTTCSNGAPANFSITGTNRCSTNLTITCNLGAITGILVTPSTVFPIGTSTVICNASDTAGHRTNCSFRVVVRGDSRPPDIRCPQDIVYPCGGAGTNVFYNVKATDDLDPAPVVTCVPPSGSFFPLGTNTVTCEARDSCGRVSRCSFRVLIASNGFTKTLQAGIADNFLPGGLEPTAPGPCLGGSGYWSGQPFDASWPGRHVAHSFEGLPANISAAKLILRMKPTQPASQDDQLRIGLQNCGAPGLWAFAQTVASLTGAGGTWNANPPTTFTLDLASLPGGVNLLASLNALHRLEFAVGTETLVDYARLELVYCGPQSTLSGVPYSSKNAYPIHQGDGGISWRTVNSNSPLTLELDLDIGFADGYRLGFASGSAVHRICAPISEFAHAELTTDWPTGNGTMGTVRFDEPGTNFYRTMVTLDQPSNSIGKMVEVWDDNPVSLVSRYFFPGTDATGVTVPDAACVKDIGFTSHYFFMDFTSPQEIDLKAPEVPATQHGGTLVTGQVGPVVMGKSVRLYCNISVADFGSLSKAPKMSWVSNAFNIPTISLLNGDAWIDAFGPQQLTISDAVLSQAIAVLPNNHYGVCSPAYGPWTIDLNGMADFCPNPPACLDGYVDINLVEEMNFGGLRLTAGDLGACTIQNNVANSVANSIILNLPNGPLTINGATSLGSEAWPNSISGNSGPQSFTAHFPPSNMVFVNGQTYCPSSATFTAQPQFLGQFYQVCIETTLLPQFSFKSFHTAGLSIPPGCLTLSCPTNVIANATSASGAAVRFNPNGATRCGSNVVVTCVPPSGSVFPPGVSVVQCSAIDNQGNQDECRFIVTVNALTPLQVRPLRPGLLDLRWTGDAVVEVTDALSAQPRWREHLGTTESNGVERVMRVVPSGGQNFFRLRQTSQP